MGLGGAGMQPSPLNLERLLKALILQLTRPRGSVRPDVPVVLRTSVDGMRMYDADRYDIEVLHSMMNDRVEIALREKRAAIDRNMPIPQRDFQPDMKSAMRIGMEMETLKHNALRDQLQYRDMLMQRQAGPTEQLLAGIAYGAGGAGGSSTCIQPKNELDEEHEANLKQPEGDNEVFGPVFDDKTPMVPIPVPPPITAWSYSRYNIHRTCPKQAYFLFVERRKEVEAEAIVRGKRLHSTAAAMVTDTPVEVLAEDATLLTKFAPMFHELRQYGARSEVQQAFTFDWEPTDWFGPRAWLRVVFDALHGTPSQAVVHEFKTGRVYDSHDEQRTLYAAAGSALFPDAAVIEVKFHYFDQGPGKSTSKLYSRGEAVRLRGEWEDKARPLLSDTTFAAKAGPHCNRCTFRRSAGGPCDLG
jgi:hypothetical protein